MRYIDADKLSADLDVVARHTREERQYYAANILKWVVQEIKNAPTADVAPRAELEHIFSDLKKEIHDKAVYPNCHGVEPYISLKVFDAVINKLIGS